MKKVSLFLFSLLVMFSLGTNVEAIGTAGDGNGGKPITGVEADVSNWYPGLSKWQVHIGIRISFVDATGKDIKTTDYILQKAANSGNLTQYAGGHSKTHYIKYGGNIDFTTGHPNLTFGDVGTLQNIFNKNNFSLSLNNYVIANWNDGTTTKPLKYAYKVNLAKDWFSKDKYTGSDYAKDLKSLLKDLLGDKIDVENEEQLKKLFMVVEPTTSIYLEGINQKGFYYGTSYELSVMANTAKEMNFPKGTYGTSGLTSFATALGKNIPCSSTLDGSIYNIMSSLGINISGFSSSKYFGSINIVSGICNKNYLTVNELIGNYGVGMAVVWFYGLIPPEKNNPTCNDIDKLLGIVGDPDCSRVYDIVNTFNNNYAELYKFNKITTSWYKENCGCKSTTPPGIYNCTPDNDVYACKDRPSNSVIYADGDNSDDYWKNCVFNDNGYYDIDVHKTSAAGALTYYESGLGNRYCQVYCTEELTASFDSNLYNVNAGSHFVWPQSANVRGNRNCKTKEIKWKEYLDDVKSANLAVKNAYGAYKEGVEKNKAIAKQSYESNSSKCSCIYNTAHSSCCTSEESYTYKDTCYRYTWNADENKLDTETYECEKIGYRCISPNNTKYGYYSIENYEVNVSLPSELGNYSTRGSVGGCENSYNPQTARANESSLFASYESAKKNAEAIAKMIRECYTWDNNTIYSVADTKLEISYDDINYPYNAELSKTQPIYNSSEDSKCESYNTKVLTCGGKSCSYNTINVKKCEYYSKKVSASQDFSLDEGIYQYVLKGAGNLSNKSIHLKDYVNYGNVNYIDIGYSNLPVSYGTKTGLHPISLTYTNLGHGNSNSGKTMLDIILGDANPENYGKWECQYNVVDDLITPPDNPYDRLGGLRLIYRPIDLKNPFPDINGAGRNVGSNWCDNGNCFNTNEIVQDVILNKQDIYIKEPMYSFILTPSAIKTIRSYNKNNGYDDFNLKCDKGTGEACISDFLNSLSSNVLDGRNIDVSARGTCMSSTYRTTSPNTFKKCQN